MTREEIDNVVCEIMYRDGPDGHVDGHNILTDFIIACVFGYGETWARTYAAKASNGLPKFIR